MLIECAQAHALKGQQRLAQGNTLGIWIHIAMSPCKGKSFMAMLNT